MKSLFSILLVLIAIPLPFLFSCEKNDSSKASKDTANEKLPVWKGFNLLNMFYLGDRRRDSHFDENDFKMMSEWGFNFARLPVDYRILINSNDWNNMNESAMKRIDKAIEYGMKYKIHICLNLHRAPGYTVASPPEATNLWTQKEPQEAFVSMWEYFTKRYKNIPSENLSFNFLNEPADVDETSYAAVIKSAADAIRALDPDRLLIADGLNYGRKPSYMLKDLNIIQATRGYEPFNLTHYKAGWVEGSDNFPVPAWPDVSIPKYLVSYEKKDVPRSIFSIEHKFNAAYNLDVNVGTVSSEARLVAKADGKIIYDRVFKSGPGAGEWTTAVYRDEWKIYQNIFNKDYRINIPAGTGLITLEVTDGDWMTVNDMRFSPVSGNGIIFNFTPNNSGWGEIIPHVKIGEDGKIASGENFIPRKWLWEIYFKPWEEFIKDGGKVIVGEWGAHNRTPHDVVLKWMEDNLQNFKEAGIGWAMWNLNDSFGILDSGRTDVEYVDFNGHKLDREMLNLLRRYVD